MHSAIQFEDRVSRSRSKHEGESSASLCDRLSRTRVQSQRQLPTDHDHAVPTREYQRDQSSPLPATAAADPVLEVQRQKQPQRLQILTGHTISLPYCPRSDRNSPLQKSYAPTLHPMHKRMPRRARSDEAADLFHEDQKSAAPDRRAMNLVGRPQVVGRKQKKKHVRRGI